MTSFRDSGLPMKASILLMLVSLVVCVGCKQSSNEMQPGDSPMSIELTSTAFQAGTTIPKQYTGDGADQSPPLHWSEPPSGTKSIALICDDPDAPRGTWVHWVLFNLPPQARELEEGVPTTATLPTGRSRARTTSATSATAVPPRPRAKSHRYFFKLYALDVMRGPDRPELTKAQLGDAMKGHILAEGQLMGTYKR